MAQEIADSTLLDTWASSGLIVEPDISKIIEGWQLGEQPPHEYMNWLQNTFGSKLNHILKNGVALWNNTTQYLAGSSVQHSGNVWLCKVDNANSEPTDANANWNKIPTIENNSSYMNIPIGTILNGYTIFSNCIVAFGGEFNRADYPKLWAYLQTNPSLVKTQAQWQTENTTNGMCGYFSSGNGTTTFRVPNLDKAFLRPDSRGIGSFQADDFKSHTHDNKSDFGISNYKTTAGSYTGNWWGFDSPAQKFDLLLNAGGIETRPKNIAVLPLIVAK